MDEYSSLRKVRPGKLPEDLFGEIARLVVLPTVVVFPMFKDGKTWQVLLLRREVNARYYPGLLHPPGTVLQPTDVSIDAALERLMKSELSELKYANQPEFASFVFENIVRGKELSLLYVLQLDEKPQNYELFDVNSLPKDVIDHDVGRIMMVVKKLMKKETTSR